MRVVSACRLLRTATSKHSYGKQEWGSYSSHMGWLMPGKHGGRTAAGHTLATEEAERLQHLWAVAPRSEEMVSRPFDRFFT